MSSYETLALKMQAVVRVVDGREITVGQEALAASIRRDFAREKGETVPPEVEAAANLWEQFVTAKKSLT